jgi:hypothetical protein
MTKNLLLSIRRLGLPQAKFQLTQSTYIWLSHHILRWHDVNLYLTIFLFSCFATPTIFPTSLNLRMIFLARQASIVNVVNLGQLATERFSDSLILSTLGFRRECPRSGVLFPPPNLSRGYPSEIARVSLRPSVRASGWSVCHDVMVPSLMNAGLLCIRLS